MAIPGLGPFELVPSCFRVTFAIWRLRRLESQRVIDEGVYLYIHAPSEALKHMEVSVVVGKYVS